MSVGGRGENSPCPRGLRRVAVAACCASSHARASPRWTSRTTTRARASRSFSEARSEAQSTPSTKRSLRRRIYPTMLSKDRRVGSGWWCRCCQRNQNRHLCQRRRRATSRTRHRLDRICQIYQPLAWPATSASCAAAATTNRAAARRKFAWCARARPPALHAILLTACVGVARRPDLHAARPSEPRLPDEPAHHRVRPLRPRGPSAAGMPGRGVAAGIGCRAVPLHRLWRVWASGLLAL